MSARNDDNTWWTMIRAAAQGEPTARDDFARRYEHMIRACLADRWRGKPLLACIDDVVQDVWHDCFRTKGVLERADQQLGGFRGFLFGVIRTCAVRAESARARAHAHHLPDDSDLDALIAKGDPLSVVFDRQWARALVVEARRVQTAQATKGGENALRRVEMLRLRFNENLTPQGIAEQLELRADFVSHELQQAKKEFRRALSEVIAFHHPHAAPSWIEDEIKRILGVMKHR